MALVPIDQALDLFVDLTGDELKAVKQKANENADKRGDLTTLPADFTESERSTVVSAITKVYNAMPSDSAMTTIAENAISSWVGAAPDALNTIIELASALQENDGELQAIMEALANRVRVDVAQNFDETKKAMGRSNIDAVSTAELIDATQVEENTYVDRFNARLNA